MIRLVFIILLAVPAIASVAAAGGWGGFDVKDVVAPGKPGCKRPDNVVSISFSKTKYPTIRHHATNAIHDGWPSVLVLNRAGADERRDRALEGIPTADGQDRDEYPPAVGRRSWKTDVAYVPSAENRSHGSVLGTKLRRYCDGVRFRYVWY